MERKTAAPRTLAQLRQHPAVAAVEQEADNGYWIDLAPGYRDTEADTTLIHERTVRECCERLAAYVRRDEETTASTAKESAGRLAVIPNPKPAPAPKAPRVNRRAALAEINAKLTHHRIAYNAEWREYRVRPTAPALSPAEREAQTYHTEDLNDAYWTARSMDARAEAC